MPNRLASSTSPYLLQHAANPVDWWPWSDEAFAEARRRDVPVFLSSGYSSCHWCHVMAHESFEDPTLASYLNEHFVAIKLDREERPDVDAVYMTTLQAMTGHGGWPMSVFLTADREPFFAGTYYPPRPMAGSPAFSDVLAAIVAAWDERRAELGEAAQHILATLRSRASEGRAAGGAPNGDLLTDAVAQLARSFDSRAGGFGNAPKFPPTCVLEFLLRRAAVTGDEVALELADRTCEAMARGGMYDQLGGGFARYSVDADWVVPHFEKMLYDNALLLRNYTHLFALNGSELARRVAIDTADFLLREMRVVGGAFAASFDADSGGHEGSFYVWSPAELAVVLGADAEWAADLLSVTAAGTFDGASSVLQLRREPDDVQRWTSVRTRLLAARAGRIHPARDDSVIAEWNGLAVGALAHAGALLGDDRYVAAARDAAEYVVSIHLTSTRTGTSVARVSRDGVAAGAGGVLADYANVAAGLLDLYAVTGEERWYLAAESCVVAMLADFRDQDGRFRDAGASASDLVLDPTDPADNATPSGVAAAAGALQTYATLSGAHVSDVSAAIGDLTGIAAQSARFAGWGLAATTSWLAGSGGVAVVGRRGDPRYEALRGVALRALPTGVAVAVANGDAASVPLLAERGNLTGPAAAYVCRNSVCQLPVDSEEQLRDLLYGV